MGLFDALTTAVSGLNTQSFAMQNISGNIANSQTTAYQGIDTSFANLIPGDSVPTRQIAGGVIANSRATNNVQGTIQSTKSTTDMAINGNGHFIVQAPTGFSGNQPLFGGIDSYTRRGDFQLDANGYLVNGSGYFLEGDTQLFLRPMSSSRPRDGTGALTIRCRTPTAKSDGGTRWEWAEVCCCG